MAASGFGYSSDSEGMGTIADINVTPLVDVVLVLLIIMMVAAPMIVNNPSIKIEPPKARSGDETAKSSLSLTLAKKKDGTLGYDLFLNGSQINETALRSMVEEEVRKNPEVQAVVAGDKGVSYGDVMHVLDVIKEAGVHKFAMVTDGS